MALVNKKLRKNINYIIKISLFTITVFIIMLLFPREGKFRYEFQKGKPWMYESLYAPFEFPIYKSQEEIATETDSVLRDFKPYFRLDKMIIDQSIASFNLFFSLQWYKYIQPDTLTNIKKIPHSYSNNQLLLIQDTLREFLNKLLIDVYEKGIIDINDSGFQVLKEYPEFYRVDDNIAEDIKSADVITLKKAYEILISGLNKKSQHGYFSKISFFDPFIQKLNLESYLVQTIFYDQSKSEKSKLALLGNLSESYGAVLTDKGIINKGDLVDESNFRILESLKIEYEKRLGNTSSLIILAGQLIIVIVTLLVLYLFLYNFRRDVFQSNKRLLFLLLIIMLITVLASMAIKYHAFNIYIIPFALVPIMVMTFYDSRLALFTHFITIMIIGFMVPNSYNYIFSSFITGIVAIFSMKHFYSRSKLLLTASLVVFTYGIVYLGIYLIEEGNFHTIQWSNFIYFVVNGLFLLSSYLLIFIFEKTFGFLSDQTLIELADTNNSVLRLLAEKAPGTFHHSLQVANLAEETIIHIGGNPLLVRTGALYHDIGKLKNPIYFVENQVIDFNPHQDIDFEESARIIIDHVFEGIDLAHKNRVPKQIIDFISTHHGTLKVRYFYISFKNTFPDRIIDDNKFTYPGPKPFSKETAVVMMADSVEAASRSMKEINTATIDDLVENIINNQVEEKQFDESNITFKDIVEIKKIFKRKLVNIYHVRIEYPVEMK